MTERTKRIFFALTVIVPFLLYCLYYYGMMVKNAPYKFMEFDSITFNYGPTDSLLNKYNSKTGDYQFVDARDSLIKSHLKLNKDDLLYLHRKAAELGFWDFPGDMRSDDTSAMAKSKNVRYYIQFKYKRKTKTVVFDATFNGKPSLKDAAERLVKELQTTMANAESRGK